MTNFIILSLFELLNLSQDEPVTVIIDDKPYTLISETGFEKQKEAKE